MPAVVKTTLRPSFFISIFCMTLFVTFMSLGVWQLDRASEKEQQQTLIQERTQRAPYSINTHYENSLSADLLSPYQSVEITGHYLPEDQFLLDNIIHKGKPGFYVLTPFAIAGTDKTILVNRGWLPSNRNRTELPDINISSTAQITLAGSLSEPRSKPVVLGNIDHPISDHPPLWYYMDLQVFKQNVSYDVLPLILKPAPDPRTKLVREWPKFEAKSGMHIGYAIQWFVFALFVLIAFLGLSLKKQKNLENNNVKNKDNNKGHLND